MSHATKYPHERHRHHPPTPMLPSPETRACGFVRRSKDPVKMTHAEMALVERGLGAKRAHAKSQSVTMMEQVCVRTWAQRRSRCAHACAGVGRAHPLASRRDTELIVGLCMHESNQPRPGVAPGDPQHEAEGWTWCPRGRDMIRQSKDPSPALPGDGSTSHASNTTSSLTTSK